MDVRIVVPTSSTPAHTKSPDSLRSTHQQTASETTARPAARRVRSMDGSSNNYVVTPAPQNIVGEADYFVICPASTRVTTPSAVDNSALASPAPSIPPATTPMSIMSYDRTCLFRIGLTQKHFWLHSVILADRSPYLKVILDPVMEENQKTEHATDEYDGEFNYPDFDEISFALFASWCRGAWLDGPKDFHSLNHYVCLYQIAEEFQIEYLKNRIMNMIRWYYRKENMTAPAFRLETLYRSGHASLLREFMVTTAAYRATGETDGGISDGIRGVLRTYPDCALDFVDALIKLSRNDRADVRRGDDCIWHEHEITERCKPCPSLEPWQNP